MNNKALGIVILVLISQIGFGQRYDEWISKTANHSYSKIEVWRFAIPQDLDSSASESLLAIPEADQQEDTLLYKLERYNQKGLLIESSGYGPFGWNFQSSVYQYDSLNRITLLLSYGADTNDERRIVYAYPNGSGEIHTQTYSSLYGSNMRSIYRFTEEGILELNESYIDNQCIAREELVSSVPNKVYTYRLYEGRSELSFSELMINRYDSLGNTTETRFLNPDSSLVYALYRLFDSENRMIEEHWQAGSEDDALQGKTVVLYNAKGEKQNEKVFENNRLISETIFKDGLARSKLDYSLNGKIYAKYEYRYR